MRIRRALLILGLMPVLLTGCDSGAGGDDTTPTSGSSAAMAGTGGAAGTAAAPATMGGSGGDTAAGAGGLGGAAGAAADPLPGGSRMDGYTLNLVDVAAAAQLEAYLREDETDLSVAATAFYALFPDEYDFLIFVNGSSLGDDVASGRFATVRRPVMPGTGIERATENTLYPSPARLKGAIGVQLSDGMPPFAHEVLHYWANDLDPALGLGRATNIDFGAHWGFSGVFGQLGGFDAATIRCAEPAGAMPPACTAQSDGLTRFVFGNFGVVTNSFQGVDYAPLELYLMGLLPRAEVPASIMTLVGGVFDIAGIDQVNKTVTVAAESIGEVTLDAIVARHGEVPLLPEADRHFAAAFVLVTAQPAPDADLRQVSEWQEIFGNHVPGPESWKAFEEHTGGRATLTTRIGRRRTSEDPVWTKPPPPPPDTSTGCSVLLQNCSDPADGCYFPDFPECITSLNIPLGSPCEFTYECVPGAMCYGEPTSCIPYCDLIDTSSALACETLCPEVIGRIPDVDDVGYCIAAAAVP